eukprot:TRINITY_DN8449_c0_g1_i1.p1 TRINITY_DN8449_c0_g1~~TRINITY_DN8449_c0_g1_i1.p1  ORF type:complete len:211 (-),score=31.15 TRINITY_DN8449_c0_g1_i1:265-897(-)
MMIPYHGYESTTLSHHPAYNTHSNTQEQPEVPKYTRLLFKLPRIVPDQKEKFEGDDIFKKHSRDGEVRYTLYRDRPVNERQAKFQSGCRDGHTEISFSGSGLVILLNWVSVDTAQTEYSSNPNSYCDFNKERGKVHLCTSFILNGVCVRWRGWLDLERMDGVACLELDTELAAKEEQILQRQLQLVQQKVRECEEIYRGDLQMKKLPGYT